MILSYNHVLPKSISDHYLSKNKTKMKVGIHNYSYNDLHGH